jgi:hypothetical protein
MPSSQLAHDTNFDAAGRTIDVLLFCSSLA